ncbi:SusC/RagA family TonB-linked outer membrane protein [Bacteroides sp.]|uniref:SusC/RagA family TonB-linked outer membrane protein n=1 Tax=Bacteroides sp. TaxID=29523 RepID=UPI0025B96564|nr:TonB-dependent receptor [Bacteroides sp.]
MNSMEVAQQAKARTVVGSVIDFETGEPIIGASVAVIGKGIGTISDLDGNFSIRVSEGETELAISFLGYEKQTVTVVDGKKLIVRLRAVSELLEEVVITAYGSGPRKDLTGAIAKANVQDMRKAPVSNFEESLAGRVAGVQVTSSDGQPGSDLQIVIRGNNSVTQDNSPLYVVDGFPLEMAVGNMLNPEEIESIEILKDASATAIYGARGANGVILVTTKKGKVSSPTVTYSGWVGVQQIIKTQEMLDPYEFVRYQLEADYNVYSKRYLAGERTLEDYRNIEGINWQDKIYRDALVHSHNIAVRGGTEKTRYSVSGSLVDQNGIMLNSGYKKYQGRFVLDQTITKKIKVGINANYTYSKKYGTIVSESQTSPTASLMYTVWGYRPVAGVNDGDLLNDLFDEAVDSMTDLRINPLKAAENEYNPLFTYNFIGNAYLEYKILKNLTLKITGGYNKIHQRKEVFYNSNSRGGNQYTNNKVNGWITNTERTSLLNENTLTYDVPLKKGHRLKVLGGFTVQDNSTFIDEIRAINVPNEALGIAGLDEGELSAATISKTANGLVSYLGRADYNYKSKYMLTVSFRADGSSKFPKNNRWAYFPSASAAWGFGEEKFVKNIKWISSGKLRAGFGTTGNNRVTDYAALTALQITPESGYSTGNTPGKGVVPTKLGNPKLKWETTMQTNIGLDMSFLDNRISLTADYYYKKTKDLLLNATMAPSMGFLSAYRNVGSVSNSGLEFTIDTKNIQTKDFSWTSSFNISFNRNKVLSLNDDEPSLASRVNWGNFNNAYPYIAIPGHPIAMFYGHIFDGVYQYTDFDKVGESYILKDGVPNNGNAREKIQPGDIKFKDINRDGVVNDYDLTIIGNPNPKHIGGFGNNFQYKNFDLNVFFQWSYGGDVLNANRIEFEGGDPNARTSLNMFASFADRWTPENQTNELYRIGGQGPAVYSSRTIEDGSFLRLKTVSLGYRLPNAWLKKINIKSLRVYASAQNLITWTKYSGPDPEVSTRPTALTPSFDWSPYPRPRTITLGVDISF